MYKCKHCNEEFSGDGSLFRYWFHMRIEEPDNEHWQSKILKAAACPTPLFYEINRETTLRYKQLRLDECKNI